jgi:hypothetical protein
LTRPRGQAGGESMDPQRLNRSLAAADPESGAGQVGIRWRPSLNQLAADRERNCPTSRWTFGGLGHCASSACTIGRRGHRHHADGRGHHGLPMGGERAAHGVNDQSLPIALQRIGDGIKRCLN